MGTHRLISIFGNGKKMQFTNGKEKITLTLPHGSSLLLSNVGEELLHKMPPPYFIHNPETAPNNATPRSDPNEAADACFLMLDLSLKR